MFDIVSAETEADGSTALACLVTAFSRDPFIRWMFPGARQYLDAFPRVLTHFAGGAFARGTADWTADGLGAALWLPPGVSPDEEALGAVVDAALDDHMKPQVFDMLEQVGAGHPEERHWYLPAMGVDPMLQGKGYGSALLARGLERCDAAGEAAYLESTNPANIPLYRRAGFEVVGEIRSGASPVITRMFRAAR